MGHNDDDAMTRQDAIDTLMATWYQRDNEFCVGRTEEEDSKRELHAALRALGVTDEEMA